MTRITINDIEYDVDQLSDRAKKLISHLKAAEQVISEKNQMKDALERAKKSYGQEIKLEMRDFMKDFEWIQKEADKKRR